MKALRSVFLRCLLVLSIVWYPDFRTMAQAGSNHLQYVNPFIGTAKSDVSTRWGNAGGTYPGAVAPSGSIQLSPETRVTGAKGYNYADSAIYYFSCFGHMSGFPEGSRGRLRIMPVKSGRITPSYSRRFSHSREVARPGYYKVVFDDDHTIVEATATPRAGVFRFTFDRNIIPQIFITDGGNIETPSASELQLAKYNAIMLFSEPYLRKEMVSGGWLFTFSKARKERKALTVKIAASTINHEGAHLNIRRELDNSGFDAIRMKTALAWQKKLSAIDVTDDSQQNKTAFYTSLYHSLLLPWVIDDADGRYRGPDGVIHNRSGANQYGVFSPWDTFRTLHPLLTLIYPDQQKDIILSMLDFYRQSGHLPVESMTGNHSVPIIVDSYLKGITGFDKELAFQAMKKSLLIGPFLQKDMPVYKSNGYVPFTYPESVTRTLEYAYDDWALAQFAKNTNGHDSIYQALSDRSYSYRHLFNKDDMLFLPRKDNSFKTQPGMSGYKEGDKWVYDYFVPHNIKDLVNLTGGDRLFAGRLDSVLQNGVILFDNETVFHVPYLFNQAGAPHLTQKWCKQIMLQRFSNTPGGLPGNDDLGSLSSWYIFSAIGLYPVCPGRPLYSVGSPLFKSVVLNVPNRQKIVIRSDQKGNYVQSLKINGTSWQQLTVSHEVLVKGSEIVFSTSQTATKWLAGKDPIELSETKRAPEFEIRDFNLSAAEVSPDAVFYARFEIVYKGSKGLKKVVVYKDGVPYAYKNCIVERNGSVRDSVVVRLYESGVHKLGVEQLEPQRVMVERGSSDPETSYRITDLAVKPMISLLKPQELSYTVQNISGSIHLFKIPVTRNDTLISIDTLTLRPGERKTVQHTFYCPVPGFHQIAAGGVIARYKVYNGNVDALLLHLSPQIVPQDNRINDISGFGNDGQVIRPDKADSAELLFDENTHVEVPNDRSLDEMGEVITVMGWIFPMGNEKGLIDIITKGDSHVLQVTDQKKLTFFAGGWGRGDCTVDLPLNWRNNWHHIAGVCSGKKLEVFIDGKLAGLSVLDESSNLSNTSRWFLGQNEEFPGERIFHGRLNHVKIFKAPLTAAEIETAFSTERREFDKKN